MSGIETLITLIVSRPFSEPLQRSSKACKGRRSEMRTVTRRIAKLEDHFGTATGKPLVLLVVCKAGWGLALDRERCIEILRECGFLPTGGAVGLVNLGQIPDGLNAQELERYLREHGAALSPSPARSLDSAAR
jgi:hypothetical protein